MPMRRLLHTIILILALQSAALAQFRYEEDRSRTDFSLGYMSVIDIPSDFQKFWHGSQFSAKPSLSNRYRIRVQKKTQYNRIIDRNLYVSASIGHYHRKNLHHAFLINAGPGFRITLPEGVFFAFEGSFGYMRTFLSGDKYAYEDGSVTGKKATGNNLFSIHAMSSFGWDFYKSHEYPVFLFGSAGLMTYFPNNEKWVLQPVFSAGLGFVLMRIKQTY